MATLILEIFALSFLVGIVLGTFWTAFLICKHKSEGTRLRMPREEGEPPRRAPRAPEPRVLGRWISEMISSVDGDLLDSEELCAICLDELREESSGSTCKIVEVKQLHCQHRFHADCLIKWWSLDPRPDAVTCPTCRHAHKLDAAGQPVFEDDVELVYS
ncbi:unnamed protein product [Durusdinium trenchii]|uniref:RING-type domain-containing protein n=1 Tax=Durusdinium trenchii TaxID=1381693 RepID=A0ABP0RD94_9DINO